MESAFTMAWRTHRTASVGKVAILGTEMATSQDFVNWVCGPEIEPEYLFRALSLSGPMFDREKQGSTHSTIYMHTLERFHVLLPPARDQKRITAVLEKADSIRRRRREAVALTEELLRSTFLELFGDPVANPKGWPVKSMDDLGAYFSYGTSTKCSIEPIGDVVLRIPNVAGGEIDTTDLKYASLGASEVARFSLEPGDLLFVRSNGNPNYIARCAVFSGREPMLFASYLIRARLPASCPVSTQFIHAVFSADSFRQQLLKEATTTAGNYNINTKGLGRQRIPLPPKELQAHFAAVTERIRLLREKLRGSATDADALFNALSDQFFSPIDSSSTREAA